MNKNIYFEKQSGNLCRLHAINHYYGKQKLTVSEFYKKCKEYDRYYATKSSQIHDYFIEGQSIISFILKQLSNDYVLLIQNTDYQKFMDDRKNILDDYLKKINAVFLFNGGHIWIRKKIDNIWYNIDSLSGVREIDTPFIKGLGHMIVIPRNLYINEIAIQIKNLKYSNLFMNINQEYFSRNLLGDGEIPIYNMFYLVNYFEESQLFKEVKKIVLIFRKDKKYLSIKNQLQKIKDILDKV